LRLAVLAMRRCRGLEKVSGFGISMFVFGPPRQIIAEYVSLLVDLVAGE
jgi:hypothetical protein